MTTANRSGTIETLGVQVATLLAPLARRFGDGEILQVLAELGYQFPPELIQNTELRAAVDSCVAAGGHLADAARRVVQASDADDLTGLAAASLELIDAVSALFDSVNALTSAFSSAAATVPALPPDELASFASELPRRLVDLAVVTSLEENIDALAGALDLFGVIERTEENAGSTDPFRPQFTRVRLRLDRLPKLLTSPGELLTDLYGWGSPTFDGHALFNRVASVLSRTGFPAFYDRSANPPVLELVVAEARVAPTTPHPGVSLRLRTGIDERFEEADETGLRWSAIVRARAPENSELIVTPNGVVRLAAPGGSTTEGELRLRVDFEPGVPPDPVVLFGQQGGARLQVRKAEIQAGVSLAWNADTGAALGQTEVSATINRGELILAPSNVDGFLGSFLPAEGLRTEFHLGLAWSSERGFSFEGGAGLEATLPVSLSVGVLTVNAVHVSVHAGPADALTDVSISAGLAIGPVHAVVDRIGLTGHVTFPKERGNLGILDVSVGFKPPNGVGLAIDAPIVVGGGFLIYDPKKEEYGGILQLEVAETIAVKAIGLLTTRMPDGSKGFSLVVIISAQGFAPIQLGFGFTLTGVGGLLGVNRTVMADVLRSGLKNGTLGSILFPDDPIRNAPQIISDLRAVFPPVKNRHVFGPMAIIGWGTPAILTLEIALILEIPEPIRLIILGRLKAILPEERRALIRVRMDSIGVIDFNRGEVSLDATLYDSRILEFTLTGDMALRANWGGKPNFVLAIGGFNPRFPAPAGFPRLERLALSLSSGDALRLRCEAYLALTSNTVQFGARLDLHAAGGGFTVDGYLGIDALFHFAPFEFAVDIGAGVALRYHGHLLMGIFLEGMLSGPTPWHVRGKASFKVLFFKVSVDFDHRFGRDEPAALPEAVDVLALLVAAVSDARNWSSELPGGEHPLVTFREQSGASTLRAHPLAQLTVRQRVVPLNMTIDTFGNAPLSGANRFTLSALRADGTAGELPLASAMLQDSFAAAQFQQMSDDEKLSRSSFEPRDAGIRFGTDEVAFRYDPLVDADIVYETQMVVPGQEEDASPPGPLYVMKASILDAVVATGAAGRAAIRRTGNARYRGGGFGG